MEGEIFRTRPDRPWSLPTMGIWSLSRVKRGHGVDYPPSFSAEVKEGVELYLYHHPPPPPALGDLF